MREDVDDDARLISCCTGDEQLLKLPEMLLQLEDVEVLPKLPLNPVLRVILRCFLLVLTTAKVPSSFEKKRGQ